MARRNKIARQKLLLKEYGMDATEIQNMILGTVYRARHIDTDMCRHPCDCGRISYKISSNFFKARKTQ